MYKRVLGAIVILSLQVVLAFGCFQQPAAALTEEQQLFQEAWRIVNRAYLDETFNNQNWTAIRQQAFKQPLNEREETYGAIQKMLASLDDPFTRLLKPIQYRGLQVNTSGELTGVGLQIALDADTKQLEVIAPIAGSPAEKAGIRPRDRILKINGISTSELTLDEAATRMRGPAGSQVTLTIQREGEDSTDIQVVRSRIQLNPVYAALDSQTGSVPIGYIRLTQFSANAPTEVAHAMTRLEQQGAQAYILDLRNNPGGLLQAGIEIARLWLNEGTIVYTVNRQGIIGSFEATESALTQAPLVVLVNQGTASASEILAGALQDNSRASIVGEKTFGKGLIQSLFDLSDGSGLAVTVAKYETPKHRDIHKVGIIPDQVVPWEPTQEPLNMATDVQYQAAAKLLTAQTVLVGAT